MFKTFGEKFEEIEDRFAEADNFAAHKKIIEDCNRMIILLFDYLFKNIQWSITNIIEQKRYLQIEREQQDMFNDLTINRIIDLYKLLCNTFPSNQLMKPELLSPLFNLFIINRKYIGDKNPEDYISDTDDALYYCESIIRRIGFKDEQIADYKFSLINFLVYESIKEKYATAVNNEHFKQIANDALKIIPICLQTVYEKTYRHLSLQQKEIAIDAFHKISEFNDIESFKRAYDSVDIYVAMPDSGIALKNALAKYQPSISHNLEEEAGLYIEILNSIYAYLLENKNVAFLEYAIEVRKLLRIGNQIDVEGQAYLTHAAKRLQISEYKASRIKDEVIKSVEKEIFNYETFYEERYSNKVKDEKSVANLFKYACLKLRDNEYTEAINDLTQIIDIKVNSAFYFIFRGIANEYIGNTKEANDDFKKALEINPKKNFYYYNRGLAKFEAADYAGAAAEFDVAIEFDPRDADYYYFRGHSKENLEQLHDAIDDYQSAIRLNPKHSEAPRRLRKASEKLARQLESTEISQTASELVANKYFTEACNYLSDGNYTETINIINTLIEINNIEPKYFIYRGVAKEYLEQIHEAKIDFKAALDLNLPKAKYYYYRGLAKSSALDFISAIKEFDRAIGIQNNEPELFLSRAKALQEVGRIGEAIIDYTKVHELNPNSNEAIDSLTYLNADSHLAFKENPEVKRSEASNAQTFLDNAYDYLRENDFEAAIIELDKAIKIFPESAFYYIYRGKAYNRVGRDIEMNNDFAKALQLNPDRSMYYFNRGKAEMEMGDYTKAIEEFNNAIELEPKFSYYTYRGRANKKIGNFREAELDFNSAKNMENT